MSKADELLASLTDEEFAAYSEIGPVDDILVIDAETRTINVPSTELLFGVETDKDVERKYFKCPRIVGDNIDLSKKQLRVHYQNASGTVEGRDKYIVEDVKVDGEYITFSWVLSKKVLAYKGVVHFTVVAVSINADGTLNKEWNTTLASGNVLEGLAVDDLYDYEEEQARDVLLQLLAMLETEADSYVARVRNAGNIEVSNVQAEGASQQEAVAKKGAETLATIPEDYTELNNLVEQNKNDIHDLVRMKANAIVGEVVGETIYVQDAAKQPPVGLSVFGKTTQDGPTNGYQLFDASKLVEKSMGGVTVTNNGDGSFTLSGSGTLTDVFAHGVEYTHEETIKLLKVGTLTCDFGDTSYPNMYMQLMVNGSIIATPTNRANSIGTVEVTQDFLDNETSCLRIGFYGGTGEAIVPGTMKPMVYQEGDGTWERFSGGKPGPNPEYQFELESVENPTVYKGSKNLLYLTERTQMDATIGSNAAAREFTGNYILPGYAYNNYYFPSNITELSITKTTVSFKSTSLAYGVGFDVKVAPNTTYTLSFDKCNKNNTFISATEYDTNGVIVKWTELASKRSGTFTTAHNTAWVVVSVQDRNSDSLGSTAVVYENILLSTGEDNFGYEEPTKIQTVELPYELRGIKLTGTQHEAYANYVDSNGVKWIGDEIDLTNGILYQWIEPLILTDFTNASVSAPANGYTEGNLYLRKSLLVNHAMSDSFQYVQSGIASVRFAVLTGGGVYITLEGEYTPDEWRIKMTEIAPTIYVALAEPIVTPLTEEQLAAYRELLMNNPITTLYNSAGAPMRLRYSKDIALCIGTKTDEITLSASKWVEQDGGSHYTQVVSVSGITANTRIDLNPTPEQLISIVDEGLSMFAANQNGVVTVYCMGGKPATDMTLPIAKQEVVYV